MLTACNKCLGYVLVIAILLQLQTFYIYIYSYYYNCAIIGLKVQEKQEWKTVTLSKTIRVQDGARVCLCFLWNVDDSRWSDKLFRITGAAYPASAVMNVVWHVKMSTGGEMCCN